jgi:hypothetical protein
MHEKLHEATRDTRLNDSLDLVVATVGEVCFGVSEASNREKPKQIHTRDGPASIDQHLIIKHVDKLGKDGQSGGNLE